MTEKAESQHSVGEPDKLDLRSQDIAADKREELLRLFPEARTEDGKVDLDRLRLALGDTVDVSKERYGLTWPGKADCFRAIQTPSLGTLRPCREESVNFDVTRNLIIEGDNLEVLKLLQKSYLGKIKMIYIDPPYNTGSDFIYPDDYSETLETYLEYTGQADAEGRRFGTNTETVGRFHSKWLSMIYPRLYLARNLLREDGVIFISIDDGEVTSLRKVCDEIFGEENFIATLVWEKGRKNDAKRFSVGHDYLVGYARNLQLIDEVAAPWREPKAGVKEIVEEYHRLKKEHGKDREAISAGLIDFYRKLPKGHPSRQFTRCRFVDSRGIWRDNNMSWPGGGGPRYKLPHPKTGKPCKIPDDGWRFIESTMKEKIRDGYVVFRENHTQPPILKSYLYVEPGAEASSSDEPGEKLQVMGSVFYRHTQPSNDVITELLGKKVFENPKDHEVIARLVRYCSGPEDTILDFFAGSGTTGHAVLDLNAADGGRRNFVLVQLPEPTGRDDYVSIAEITKQRVRRVIEKLNTADNGKLPLEREAPDRGFRVFKLAESNFAVWDAAKPRDADTLGQQLRLHVDHIRRGRSASDLLYEILLKSGFPLTTAVEALTLEGKTVYSVAGGDLLVCLDRALNLEVIRAMAAREPARVVCLDVGFFDNDQLKANAVQTFKTKGVTSFKTV